VEHFSANGHSLYDMAGNVWEWTVDDFVQPPQRSCCAPPSKGDGRFASKAIKGGSHPCATSGSHAATRRS